MTTDVQRRALLQRITELVESPSLAHLLDHYLQKLQECEEKRAAPCYAVG